MVGWVCAKPHTAAQKRVSGATKADSRIEVRAHRKSTGPKTPTGKARVRVTHSRVDLPRLPLMNRRRLPQTSLRSPAVCHTVTINGLQRVEKSYTTGRFVHNFFAKLWKTYVQNFASSLW